MPWPFSGSRGGSFSERNLPARQPTGPVIPLGVRRAILVTMLEAGVDATTLWGLLSRRQGYGRFEDVAEDIAERFSDEQAAEFREQMSRAIAADQRRMSAVAGVNYLAEPALLAIPEALFLDAVEYGFEPHHGYAGHDRATGEINALLEPRGIYFRFDRSGHAQWVGDPGTYETIVAPALAAFQDARLAGVQGEFEAALRHLRAGSAKEQEDAIDEAAKSVESSMKVLLDERRVGRDGREAAQRLFDLLRDNGIVEAEADKAVTAAARIRNQWGGHGAGATPRMPPIGLADVAVQSAGAAIVYLARRLP